MDGFEDIKEALTGHLMDELAFESIRSVEIKKEPYERLLIHMENGRILCIWDGGQDCCERRYMTCDDDLTAFAGATLNGVKVSDVKESGDRDACEVHESQWLTVETSNGSFTVCTHNEHNGWYGGFELRASLT